MIPSKNRIEILVKYPHLGLMGAKGLIKVHKDLPTKVLELDLRSINVSPLTIII